MNSHKEEFATQKEKWQITGKFVFLLIGSILIVYPTFSWLYNGRRDTERFVIYEIIGFVMLVIGILFALRKIG